MLGFLSVQNAASRGAEEVILLLETHCTAGLTDEQVIVTEGRFIVISHYLCSTQRAITQYGYRFLKRGTYGLPT